MSLLRKLVVVVGGVGLALLLTILLVEPRLTAEIANIINNNPFGIRVALAALLDVLILLVIVALVRDPRPRPRAGEGGLVVKAQGAVADVSVPSVRDLVLKAVRDVPNVKSAEARIGSVRGKADIELDVVVYGDKIVLPDKQKEIDRALRQVVNKQLGLQMAGKPRVHIQLDDRLDAEPSLLLGDTFTPTPPPSVIVAPPRSDEPSLASEQPGMFVRPLREESTMDTSVEASPVESGSSVAPERARDESDVTDTLNDAVRPPLNVEAHVSTESDGSLDEKPEDQTRI